MPPTLGGLATVEVDSESYGGLPARMIRLLVLWGERALALAVFAAVLAFAVDTSREIVTSDWGDVDVINRSIASALVVGIGFELARLLVTHELVAVLELMAFALARKILTPGSGASEMLLIVLAFVVIVGARRYLSLLSQTHRPRARGYRRCCNSRNAHSNYRFTGGELSRIASTQWARPCSGQQDARSRERAPRWGVVETGEN